MRNRSRQTAPIMLDWARLLGFNQVRRPQARYSFKDVCFTKIGGKDGIKQGSRD